jgi:hypothetical protein
MGSQSEQEEDREDFFILVQSDSSISNIEFTLLTDCIYDSLDSNVLSQDEACIQTWSISFEIENICDHKKYVQNFLYFLESLLKVCEYACWSLTLYDVKKCTNYC